MIFFKINSKTLNENPKEISQSKYKLQKTDRTINGSLVADIIAIKNKVSFTWDFLSMADLKKLVDEVNCDSYPTVEYIDESGELKQIVGYASEIGYAPYYDPRTKSVLWKDVQVSFEER